jgi:hypothetical protein
LSDKGVVIYLILLAYASGDPTRVVGDRYETLRPIFSLD